MENFGEFLSSPVGVLVAAAAAFLVGSMAFSVKQWEAHWKQWAIDTSKAMSKAGLVHTPKILDALAVGDLAGAFQQIKGLADVFKDPQQLSAEFQSVFQNMLQAAFKDPTQAKALQQLANDAVAAFASGDPALAAAKLTADVQEAARNNPLFAALAQNGLQLPSLNPLGTNSLLSQLAGNLAQRGLAQFLPLAGASSTSNSAPSAAVPAVPPGHTVTIAGPAAATDSKPATPAG